MLSRSVCIINVLVLAIFIIIVFTIDDLAFSHSVFSLMSLILALVVAKALLSLSSLRSCC